MAGYLGRRGISLLRPVLLATFGVFAWLVWLAGPSQAGDLLPAVPAVPSPSVSPAPVSLSDPIGSIVGIVPSAIPSPSQMAGIPKTLVNRLPTAPLTPVVGGIIDAVPPLIENTIRELPSLPELPSVPALPPVPGILPPTGTNIPAVPASGNDASELAPRDATTILRTSALSPAVQTGPSAGKSILRFTPDRPAPVFPAELAMTNSFVVAVDPPADAPDAPAASPRESGSTSGPQGGSAHGAADLPEQRALLPPFHDGRVPEGRQNPAAEPAFDPGSSPD